MNQLNKKYPKSKNGKQCVGICYKKNTKIIHPIYSHVVTDLNKSFCPVAEFYEKENGKMVKKDIDECNENIQKMDYIYNEIDFLYPYVDFNISIFLNICYNINTFSDGLTWITDNSHLMLDTRERIFNLIIDAYSSQIDIVEISDNRIVDFLNILIRTKYSYTLKNLFKFIHIDDKTVSLHEKSKDTSLYKKETDESIVIKTNYILKNIITTNNITNFLSKYFKEKIEQSIEKTQTEIMINKFIIYLTDNIKKSFSK
jgi:hypothetical protein